LIIVLEDTLVREILQEFGASGFLYLENTSTPDPTTGSRLNTPFYRIDGN
jgi:hypothetical protein